MIAVVKKIVRFESFTFGCDKTKEANYRESVKDTE